MRVEFSIITRGGKGFVAHLFSAAVLLWGASKVEGRAQSGQPPREANKPAEEIRHKFEDALAAYRNQQYARAEGELRSLLASSPESFEVNELAGLVFVGANEYTNADLYLAKAVR